MISKFTVAALAALVMFSLPIGPARAQDALEGLMAELRDAESPAEAQRLENRIIGEWSKSGSAAMDLLLKRGRDALDVSDHGSAIAHFRALTDHAPGFAEGWHGLALAYYQAERFGPALDALERVLMLNPEHFGALRGVGAIHEQVDRPQLAYQAYERVLGLRPHDEDVQNAIDRLESRARGIEL